MCWALCQGLYIIISIKLCNKEETEAQRNKVTLLRSCNLTAKLSNISYVTKYLTKIIYNSVLLLSTHSIFMY